MPDEDKHEGTPFGQDNIIFGTSTTAKRLFDESDEEESPGAFAATISGKKSS